MAPDTGSRGVVNEETNALYEACVGFMVAEKSNTDSWEKVARFVDGLLKGGKSLKEIKTEFFVVEHQIKKDFGVSTMPSAWRSAKSTALKAAAEGRDLVSAAGVAGKTAVSKKATHPKKDGASLAMDHLASAHTELMGVATLTVGKWVAITDTIGRINEQLGRIGHA
jgi:hypothetical protein